MQEYDSHVVIIIVFSTTMGIVSDGLGYDSGEEIKREL